jgi:MYXO-CTERM domain-containing protein
VRRNDQATVSVTYSDVWGNQTNYVGVTPGVGAISADPRFVSATDPRLGAGSPCIDALAAGPLVDIAGVARPVDGHRAGGAAWDMGAFEHVPSVRCGDGYVEDGEACDDGNTAGGDGCSAECTVEPPPDASVPDAGVDAAVDAGVDAGVDAAVDAGVDAAVDAGADATVDAAPDTIDAAPGEPDANLDCDTAPDAGEGLRFRDEPVGCSTGGGAGPWLIVLIGLALARRRRWR